MKKTLLKLLSLGVMTFGSATLFAQTMYLDEMFDVSKQANIVYDSNRSVNILYQSGYPNPTINNSLIISANLICDVYRPVGSSVVSRPTIIIAHTGSYLPVLANKQTTGSKDDSAVVEMCTRLAKRGFNAIAVNYRQGWNALATPPTSTEQLLNATYRGAQDIRNAVRFLNLNAATYGIDTNKIIIGGQGTGGYIALAYATVNKTAEVNNIAKFQRNDFTPMVSIDTLGDWTGVGGNPFFNVSGDANVSSSAQMVFHYGGAMGDLIWLDSSSLPIVGMQSDRDPFAPFNTGNVIVPTNMTTVIPSASGAGAVVPKANALGVNAKLNSKYLVDPISTLLRDRTSGVEHLYPVRTNYPQDGAPWEWWDRAAIQAKNTSSFYAIPIGSAGLGRTADSLSMLGNPDMSVTKAKKYIDTLVDFSVRRIAVQFDLVPASNDQFKTSFGLVSPANNSILVVKGDGNTKVDINWDAANTTGFGAMSYAWKLSTATNTNFGTPLASLPCGAKPGVSVDYNTIKTLLASVNVNIGDTADLKWTVEGTLNNNSKWSSDTFNIKLIRGEITAVKEIANLNKFLSVYPNPASDILNINLDAAAGSIATYQLMDVTGRLLLNGNAENNAFSLNVDGVNPGLYFVNITLKDGSVATKRVIIQ
jgi:hypothetical protein